MKLLGLALSLLMVCSSAQGQIAVRGDVVYTMDGPPIRDGVVVIRDGAIAEVGPAMEIVIPEGFEVLEAAVVTPGLIDAHATVGLSGILNQPHDQDQLERSGPIQPELRALDAYNTREELVEWVRSFGVTTVHTGHAPGELISGQTLIVKTVGNTVEQAMISDAAAVAATLGPMARRSSGSPGTRGKMMAMLRAELIKAQEYRDKRSQKDDASEVDEDADDAEVVDSEPDESHDEASEDDSSSKSAPSRNLRLEALQRVLDRELPLLITVHKAQDIASALRLAGEFDIRIWLDGAAEAYLLVDEIKAAGVPVILHPSMARATGDMENMSFETAATLRAAGIPVVMQSGYERYVPKTRVVLFEAAITAANGLTLEQALATITADAADVLGIADRVGRIRPGLDGDLALYCGDPFEYTSHCIGVIVNGQVVHNEPR